MGVAAELARRGHEVHVQTLASGLERVRALGIAGSPIDSRIESRELDDWKAKNPLAALERAMQTFADRASFELADLQSSIATFRPDLLVVDTNTWGAQAVAEASGLPWALFQPYFTALPAVGVPPFGPGFAPISGPIGRLRDRVLGALVTGKLAKLMLPAVNPLRAELGLQPVTTLKTALTRAPLVLYFTVPELEYPRERWPASYRFVGPALGGPSGAAPAWLDDVNQPIVVVTCSTEHQDDRALVETALAALPSKGYFVVATTAAHNPASFDAPAEGAIVERFLPHAALLKRAVVAIAHGGMGITQRALANGVPVVVIPFGRDQNEVARRVDHAGVGVRLPRRRLRPESLTAAVDQASTLRKAADAMSARMAAAGGDRAAANAIEELLQSRTERDAGTEPAMGRTVP